jgi:hypothetical protein
MNLAVDSCARAVIAATNTPADQPALQDTFKPPSFVDAHWSPHATPVRQAHEAGLPHAAGRGEQVKASGMPTTSEGR